PIREKPAGERQDRRKAVLLGALSHVAPAQMGMAEGKQLQVIEPYEALEPVARRVDCEVEEFVLRCQHACVGPVWERARHRPGKKRGSWEDGAKASVRIEVELQ